MIPRLQVKDLRIHGVGPVSLDIGSGECLGLSGPSGAGKTLILRAIADMEPHRGKTYFDGEEQAQVPAPAWRRKVALLAADSMWWFDTVEAHFNQPDAAAFDQLGFDTRILRWPVSRLSSGERQRLALLRLLENRPLLLLLDEPTANLDQENAARVEALIQAYRLQTGAAVLWVGHQASQLQRVADRTFAMVAGRLTGEEEGL